MTCFAPESETTPFSMRRKDVVGTVYLIHFDRPYEGVPVAEGNKRAVVQHYLGWTKDIDMRRERHYAGHGSKLLAAVARAGIPLTVARVWRGTRKLERAIKHYKKAWVFCPICCAERGREVIKLKPTHPIITLTHHDDG